MSSSFSAVCSLSPIVLSRALVASWSTNAPMPLPLLRFPPSAAAFCNSTHAPHPTSLVASCGPNHHCPCLHIATMRTTTVRISEIAPHLNETRREKVGNRTFSFSSLSHTLSHTLSLSHFAVTSTHCSTTGTPDCVCTTGTSQNGRWMAAAGPHCRCSVARARRSPG